jgi:hypothetical protein
MNIVIYGVGRSGTKAIQLYLAYHAAVRSGKVHINYEPYLWLNRKTRQLNYEGYLYNTTSPHFARSSSEFNKHHIRYIDRLVEGKNEVVTKFIRGNGRIKALNEILQPDETVIIIRDLYEVLVSLLRTEWNFWSVGFDFHVDWNKFIAEIRKKRIIDNLDWCLGQLDGLIDRNAFYWYVMNVAALENKGNNIHIIPYKQINAVNRLGKEIYKLDHMQNVSDSCFNGELLHRNYPLTSNEPRMLVQDIFNSFLHKSKLSSKFKLVIKSRKIGSEAYINLAPVQEKKPLAKPAGLTLERKDIFEFFNEDIANRMANHPNLAPTV